MRIVAIVKSLENACCRYRVAAFRPLLEQAGHSLRLLPWPRTFWSRRLIRRHLAGADVLLLQRRMPHAGHLAAFRAQVPYLIYDFDDAVFLRDSLHRRGPHCPHRAQRFRSVVQAADAVVAGNRFLHEQASLWVQPERLHLIPTCLDPARYAPATHADESVSQLAWIGSASTLRSLQRFRPFLEEVGSRIAGLRFKIICDTFLHLDNMHVVRCPWAEQTEAAELAQAQIGVSFLPDDLWSRGKCALKILQYMAAGLPVVANPVGLHPRLVVPGQTGFLVETAAECAAAIRLLLDNPAMRRRMGQAGRELVQERFQLGLGAAAWLRLLDKLPAPRDAACGLALE